jgi:hypothetical protein
MSISAACRAMISSRLAISSSNRCFSLFVIY